MGKLAAEMMLKIGMDVTMITMMMMTTAAGKSAIKSSRPPFKSRLFRGLRGHQEKLKKVDPHYFSILGGGLLSSLFSKNASFKK